MNTKTLRKNYDRLTANERFKAVLAAYGRGDKTECKALADACPRRTYRMTDADYSQRLETTESIGNLVVFQLLTHLYCGNMSDMVSIRTDDSATIDRANIIAQKLNNTAAGIWHGFVAFCGDIGVDPDDFLALSDYGIFSRASEAEGRPVICVTAFDGVREQAARFGNPDPDEVEGWRRELMAFWAG